MTPARAGALLALPPGRHAASLDLGVSQVDIAVAPSEFLLPDGTALTRECVLDASVRPVHHVLVWDGVGFVGAVRGVARLVAGAGAPSLQVSGVQMHRTTGIDPYRDGANRARAVVRAGDRVLDCCTGLGYSALEALAIGARSVLTCEINPDCAALLDLNPWSAPLAADPRIDRRLQPVEDVLPGLPDRGFDACIHDPPRFSLAGELYAGAFYRELARVLRPGGRLCHYTGDPGRGRTRLLQGMARRLVEAGFVGVRRDEAVDGFVAERGPA